MSAQDYHKKAEELREKGEFVDALKVCDEAVIKFLGQGDVAKAAEVLASRALTLRHLSEDKNDKNYLILAKHEAKAGIKMVEKAGLKSGLATPLYTLAKCYESLGKIDDAVEKIEEALQSIKNDPEARPSLIAEMNTRMAALKYRLGDDSALNSFNAALEELSGSDEDSYVKNVWMSGAHLHMVEAAIARESESDAREHLMHARSIIESDERLILRRKQLSRVESLLS